MSDEFPVKIREVRVRHKSGTIYVERRHCRYDPALQHNVVVKSERIGKIDPETGQIVPCRPKRKKTEAASEEATKPAVEAPSLALALGLAETMPTNGYDGESERTGLAKLFDLVGRASGLEACVRYAFPEEKDAEKILAVARYWAATDDPLRRIESRRREEDDGLFHSGLDAVCDFFEMLGYDESGIDALFTRLARLDDDDESPVLVFESSARSGSSAPRGGLLPDLSARRLLTVYTARTRLPVAFELLSGTVTDIVGLKRAAKLAKRFSLARPEFVLESARSEEGFLADLLRNRLRFTAPVDLTEEWVREPLEEAGSSKKSALEELDTWGSISSFDSSVNGVSRCRTVEFPRTRSASRSGMAADEVEVGESVETKPYRLYLHYFRDANAAHAEREEHKALVYSLKSALEGGTSLDELTEGERAIAEKYLVLSRAGRGGKLQVAFNTEALGEAERRYGIFCIASNTHKDPWKVLRRCRMRNRIEESFCTSPTRRVGDRTRVWSVFQARGREVCRLAALGYRFYMQSILNAVRDEAAHLAYGTRSSMANAVDYGDVRRLLEDMPLRNLMAYLDCPEALKRDRLLFEMLSSEAYRMKSERRWEETLPHEEADPL